MESMYFEFVNFWRDMKPLWFGTICLVLLALTFINIAKFFKKYDGTQKEFIKLNYIVLAVLFFAVLVYLVSIRK